VRRPFQIRNRATAALLTKPAPLTAPEAIRTAAFAFDFQTVRKMVVLHAVDKGSGAFRRLAAPFT
jgi:hypothetical protein